MVNVKFLKAFTGWRNRQMHLDLSLKVTYSNYRRKTRNWETVLTIKPEVKFKASSELSICIIFIYCNILPEVLHTLIQKLICIINRFKQSDINSTIQNRNSRWRGDLLALGRYSEDYFVIKMLLKCTTLWFSGFIHWDFWFWLILQSF